MENTNFEYFKERRKKLGLTQAKVAELAGYSVSAINGMENRGIGDERLRARIQEVLSEPDDPAAVKDDSEAQLWKARALAAEQKVVRLRRAILSLLRAMDDTDAETSKTENL